ncbi:MAG: hypothetical protein K2X43_10160 [Hyphomonadaceae bacterium]|nr:hypothetical protein [Hyphomonadaceae bacterium]
MASALLFADAHGKSRSRAHVHGNFHLVLDLIAPALLLGLWRVWSAATAPRLGIYFTAEAVLIAYAYFAVIRSVHLNARSYDGTGRYSRMLAARARQDFGRELRRHWLRIALAMLSLLSVASALDALTAGTGIQHRPNVHLTLLFVEIMVWARYGAAIVVASARWTPPRPPSFAHARALASSHPVAGSFALANLAFGITALAAVAGYKWAGALLPSARAELVCSAGLFTGLALLALWLHCRWSLYVEARIAERSRLDLSKPLIGGVA